MRCPNCKNKYQDHKKDAHRCPFCGHIPTLWERLWADKTNIWKALGGILFIVIVFIAIKTRLDGLIFFLVILTFNFAASLISFLMFRHLRKRVEKDTPREMVFLIPPFFNHALYFCILLLTPVMILLPISWLNRTNTQVDTGLGIGLPLMLSPIMIFALLMLRFNSGAVVLTSDEIIRYYPFTKKKMLLSDIKRLNTNLFSLPPGISLSSKRRQITFPRAIKGYPELLQHLQTITKLSPQEKKRKKITIQFPMILEIPKRRMTIEVLSMIGLVVLYLGVALSGLWGLLSNGHVPPFESEDIKTILIFFLMMSVFFIPALIAVYIAAFKKDKPVQINLTQKEIKIYYLSGKTTSYPASRLQRVWLQPVSVNMRSSFDGAVVRGRTTTYEVHIKFKEQEDIIFNNTEIRFLTVSPEKFVEIFHTLYEIN